MSNVLMVTAFWGWQPTAQPGYWLCQYSDSASGSAAPDGRPCREFQQTVTISGRIEEAFDIACREPDGTLRIVS